MLVLGEKLIEFAIRIGVQDIIEDLSIVDELLPNDKLLGEGLPIFASQDSQVVAQSEGGAREEFQKKIDQLWRKPSETGMSSIWNTGYPTASDVKAYLQTMNVSIRHGFPRETQDLPCVCINLGSEDEQGFIGHHGWDLVTAEGERQYQLAMQTQASYNISIITTNYDETMIWHLLVKYALLKYSKALEGYGLQSMETSWSDVEPASEYLQAGVFVFQRSCLVRCMKLETISASKLGYLVPSEIRVDTITSEDLID